MEATLGGLENSIYSEWEKEKPHGRGIKTWGSEDHNYSNVFQ
jgi:hypothetical protein